MSPDIPFKIDGKTLELKAGFGDSDQFQVKSSPWNYTVRWTEERPANLVQRLCDENRGNVLLIDEIVYKLHCANLQLPPERMLIARSSENYKTLHDGVLPFIDLLSKRGISKSEKVIIVGGGVIQDVGAFSACLYKRGIPFVLVPTTLLSMCDSCIGGKAGVNHQGAKNQLALFSSPREVYICPDFLNTLELREVRAGLGEILKLHIIGGPHAFEHYKIINPLQALERPSRSEIRSLIMGALQIKKAVIEDDEFEISIRRALNYGHTIGHALESLSDYAIPHGHAVTVGMLIVNDLAFEQGLMKQADRDSVKEFGLKILDSQTHKVLGQLQLQELGDLLKKDKKTKAGKVTFVMIATLGDTHFIKAENDEILSSRIRKSLKSLAR